MPQWLKNIWKIERSRKLSIIFGVMIVVGLILVSLGVLANIKVTPYATYTNKKIGIAIKFPAYWKPVLKPKGGAIVVFVAPRKNSMTALWENFNITIKNLPQAMTLAYLNKIMVTQVTGTLGDQIEITESIPFTLAGHEGYRLTFSGYSTKKIPNPIQYVFVWTMIDTRVYILTFTGLKDDYALNEKKVNAMIDSFRIFPPQLK